MADHEPIEQKLADFYGQSRAGMTRPIPTWDPMRRKQVRGSGFRQLVAASAVAAFILAIAGGAYFLRQNQTQGQAETSPQVSPTASSSAPTSGPLAVFVGGTAANPSEYVVSLVNASGQTVASATAARRSSQTGTALPVVSTSATRVYYLDGDAQIRALTPDGTTAAIVKLEASGQVHAAFAVSPDDRRIAVTTIDYQGAPPRRHLYVSDLNGANRSEVSVSGNAYVWPVGWHEGNLVLASGDANAATVLSPDGVHPWCDSSAGPCTADNPYSAVHGFELVDPKTGTRLANLGSDQCRAIGLLTSAGTLCREGSAPSGLITPTQECQPQLTTCLRLADWSGAFTEWTTLATVWIGALTPSAKQMAGCCNVDAINLYDARAAGGSVTRVRTSAAPVAWLDDYTLIYQPFGSPAMHMLGVNGGADATVDAPGIPVAILSRP